LPAAGAGAALAPLSLAVGANGFVLLAAVFFCAGDAAAAGVVTAALARLAALALCLGVVGCEAGVAARASMRASSGVAIGVVSVSRRGVAARGDAGSALAGEET